jgi:hypothetical protein
MKTISLYVLFSAPQRICLLAHVGVWDHWTVHAYRGLHVAEVVIALLLGQALHSVQLLYEYCVPNSKYCIFRNFRF